MANRGLLSFRHTEMVWHTEGKFEPRSEAECLQHFLECVKTFLNVYMYKMQ